MAVLQSLAAQLRPTNANFGEKLAGLRATGENIAASQQRRGVVDRQQKMQQVQFLNRLAKSLKGQDPSQWGQTLTPHLPVLQQMGFDPRQLQGLTPEQIDDVITRTDAALGPQEQNFEQQKIDLRREELGERQRVANQKAGELKPGVQKILDTAQNEAIEAGARARQLGTLENDLLAAGDIGGGKGSTFSEFLKQNLGTQDDVTELRRRYNAIRSSEAVQNLPPGVASDKDIELALKGFPAENAPKEQLVSFLRGARKMARIREEYNRIKSGLISEQGSTRNLLAEMDKQWNEVLKGIDIETQSSAPSAGQGDTGVVNWGDL